MNVAISALWLAVQLSLANEAQTPPDAVPAQVQESSESAVTYVLKVTPPISDEFFERAAELLQLSPEQANFFSNLRERYRHEVAGIDEKHMRELQVLNRKAATMFSVEPTTSYASARLYEQFFEKQRLVDNLRQKSEDRLFQEFMEVLDDDDLQMLERIRWLCRRERCPRQDIDLPAARIDLSEFVQSIIKEEELQAAVRPILIESESALTPLYEQLTRLIWERAVQMYYIDASRMRDDRDVLLEPSSPEAMRRDAEGWKAKRRLLEEGGRIQIRIAALNRQYIERVVDALPAEVGQEVLDFYRVAAYPKVYPDPSDVMAIVDALTQEPTTHPEKRDAVLALLTEYRSAYRIACAEMEDRFERWKAYQAGGQDRPDWYEYRDKMRSLRDKRISLAEKLLEQVEAVHTPEIIDVIIRAKESLNQLKLRIQGEQEWPGV